MPAEPSRGLVDTNVVILHSWLDPAELPDRIAISTVTLAELSAGVHLVQGDSVDARAERARRTDVLQRAESELDPIPFDANAARAFGRVSSAVRAVGRSPRRRVADLLIASVAAAQRLPLYTTNPDDFVGLSGIVTVVPVRRDAETESGDPTD